MKDGRLDNLFQFSREIDKSKFVDRKTYLSDGKRRENDAEHSWHMAVMALLFCEYANEEIDLLKVISMILIHDIVEIDAGDTFAYDVEGLKTQHKREEIALNRIFSILPKDKEKELKALFLEFEEEKTIESKFAHAMDNIQPVMLNAYNNGKGWEENKIRISQILKRQEITPKGSKKLFEYEYDNFIKPYIEKKKIIDDIGRE